MLWKLFHFPLKLKFFFKLMSLFCLILRNVATIIPKEKKPHNSVQKHIAASDYRVSWCFNSNTKKSTRHKDSSTGLLKTALLEKKAQI